MKRRRCVPCDQRHPRGAKHRQGQSVVEFALLLPILLGLLLGTIDTAMLLSAKNTVAYACRQGARMVEQGAHDSDVLAAIVTALKAGGANPNALVSVTIYRANPDDTTADPVAGDNPAMHVVYPFSGGVAQPATDDTYSENLRAGSDNFGITVRYHYTGLTPLFSGGLTFADVTNAQIDPAGNVYNVATPQPAPTLPPAAPQLSPTPRPTYTPLPTYTPPPTAPPTATTPPTATPVPAMQTATAQASQTAGVQTATAAAAATATAAAPPCMPNC